MPQSITIDGRPVPIDQFMRTTGLRVERDLNLYRHTRLTALPEGLTVAGSLYLIGCTSLTSLPSGLTVGEHLNLSGCTSLTSMPRGLTVGGSLYLNGCTAITALPEGLTVEGYLNLSGCTSLTSMPRGLTVGVSLYLGDCPVDNVGRGGTDSRGYEFFAVRLASGIRLIAGCRNFSLEEAEHHWARRPEQLMLARRALQRLEEIEARALGRSASP